MVDKILGFLEHNLLPAVLILVVGLIVRSVLLKLIKKLLERENRKIDRSVDKVILSVVSLALWLIIIFTICPYFGINTASLITVFAAAGAAIALALQGSLSNIAAGILIMVNKPFAYGDFIESAGTAGTVESIGLFATTIVTPDNKTVSIPNSAVTSGTISNVTRKGTRRVDVSVGVAYGSDLEKAKAAIIEAAKKTGFFLETPAPCCDVNEHASSAIVLFFRGWCKSSQYWDAYFGINNAIKAALDEAGIEIPFPQVDVHQK